MASIAIMKRRANKADETDTAKTFTENQFSKIELRGRGEAIGFEIVCSTCPHYVGFEHGTSKGS